MSSSIKYLPVPPRVWSRVQNPCSADTYNPNTDYARAEYDRQMLLKGNILQYKKNSSNLTKKQRYTQIAKGMWTNRTKTWATQSDTYTNPNMTSLLRVNSTILDPSNNAFSSPPNPFGCPTTTIPDGGNLVCNVVVDPCTQEVIKRTQSQQLCNPTTDSDVPGQIQDLCWNDGTQTWYPRQRYVMPTSGTKWPVGYKGFVSAVTFVGPVLSVGNVGCGTSIPLIWTFLNSTCLPITSFNIYQNGVLIQNVPVSVTSETINETVKGTFIFYVTSLSNSIESKPSNRVIVSTEYGYSTDTAFISNNGKTISFLESGNITINCIPFNVNCTCVGGGGGGGGGSYAGGGGGGGGGGGEVQNSVSLSLLAGTYIVTVGNGGASGAAGNSSVNNGANGANGEDSLIDTITAIGGYGGAGGASGTTSSNYGAGGAGGNNGNNTGGGAGGAGGLTPGGAGNGTNGGGGGGGGYDYGGGAGSTNSTSGSNVYGSGGGGGGGNSKSGGKGGTNAGDGSQNDIAGGNGTPNKGGGGGGGKSGNDDINTSWGGGEGGSGVVIINIL